MIRILNFNDISPEEILCRDIQAEEDVSAAVDAVIADVRARGDGALREYSLRFDGAELDSIAVSEEEMQSAMERVGEDFLAILRAAAENIREFHTRQMHNSFVITKENGVVLGQRYTPIEKVGICVPGNTAAYPSSVLMDAIPAKIAGVSEIVMVTPPDRDGKIADAVLAAAKIAGVTKIFKIGGAQAVAALAYGTESVPRVDKIVGPGGIFVATAKRKVFGRVAIDMIAGPSEILVLSDGLSDPRYVAADMLSQAEHDVLATAVLVTDSEYMALAVQQEIEKQLAELPREDIARTAIENNSKIILTDSLEKAAEAANIIAPEHLELCVEDPFALMGRIKNAGSIFLGRSTPEAMGDYFAGPNHTLPTSGTARFSSPLSVDDYVKKSSFIYYTPEALKAVAPMVAEFAEREGLHAHARSVTIRCEDEKA